MTASTEMFVTVVSFMVADVLSLLVGARGFEPLTSSASRKRSPPELSARFVQHPNARPRFGRRPPLTRVRRGPMLRAVGRRVEGEPPARHSDSGREVSAVDESPIDPT